MNQKDSRRPTVKFHYLKSSFFRVVHSDGAIAGLTPNRDIILTFFNQRVPLPDSAEHVVNDDGSLGEEIGVEAKHQGIMRELEVGVVLDHVTAKAVAEILGDRLRLLAESERTEEGSERKKQ